MVPGSTMQASKGERQSIVPPSYDAMTPINNQYGISPSGCSSGTHTMAVANDYLIGCKSNPMRRMPCLVVET